MYPKTNGGLAMQKRLSLSELKAKGKQIETSKLLDSIKGGVLAQCHGREV
jgi:hypothetical protein